MNFKLENLANFEFLGLSNLLTNCSENYNISFAFRTRIEMGRHELTIFYQAVSSKVAKISSLKFISFS